MPVMIKVVEVRSSDVAWILRGCGFGSEGCSVVSPRGLATSSSLGLSPKVKSAELIESGFMSLHPPHLGNFARL